MYLSIVGDSCSIMDYDYELTMDYEMIVSLGNGWFQYNIYDCIDIWNMWLTCVSSCRVTCLVLAWQGNTLCFYITNSWVMWQHIVSLDSNKVKR